MYITKSKILSLETQMIAGFLFTGALGVLLHFLYQWTGNSVIVAAFSPVNESPWEHLKTVFFPILFFLIIQIIYLKSNRVSINNLTWFTSLSALLSMTFITVAYYTYTGIIGSNLDWLNISIFFISAATAYYFNYRMLRTTRKNIVGSNLYGLLIFLVLITVFAVFTFFPPEIPWFRSSV